MKTNIRTIFEKYLRGWLFDHVNLRLPPNVLKMEWNVIGFSVDRSQDSQSGPVVLKYTFKQLKLN